MSLTIQNIRAFLANQTTAPLFQNGGLTPATSLASQVQDSYSFSATGTTLAAESQTSSVNSLELLRARFDAAQETLPARQDSAVFEANRTNFNLFRDALERLKGADNQTNAPQTTQVETFTAKSNQVAEVAGVPIPATAERQLDPLAALENSFGDVTASAIASTLDTTLSRNVPVSRPQPAEDLTAPVFTPSTPLQPDTTPATGFRTREQGGFITTPLQNRSQEDVSTVVPGQVTPNQTTGFTPLTPTPGILGAQERRSFALNSNEEQNNGLFQPPGRTNDRGGLAGDLTNQGQIDRQPGTNRNRPTETPPVAPTAPLPTENVQNNAQNNVQNNAQNNVQNNAQNNVQNTPANGNTTLAGATTTTFNPFSLRGTLTRSPTEERNQAINQQNLANPQAGFPLANNPQARTTTGATTATGAATAAGANTTPAPNATAPATPPPANQAIPFAFFGGFQGRTGEANPATLPQAATLNFTPQATATATGPTFTTEAVSPAQTTSRAANSENGATLGRSGRAANSGFTTNPTNRLETPPTPANANQTPAPEQVNPNPTIIPINRAAALSFYARQGGFGREQDVSQGPALSLVA